MGNKRHIAILLAILCLAGCRSHKELSRKDNGNTGRDTVPVATTDAPRPERLDTLANANYSTLQANFRCSVQNIAVNGQLRMAKDSIIWGSINKVIELGRMRLTPDRAQAYAKMMGLKYDFSYSKIQQQWGIDIDFATLQALIVGNCPPGCTKSKEPQRNGDTVTLWFTQNNTRQLTLKKDYRTKRIMAATLTSKTTGQRIELTYGNRTTIDGQLLPTSVSVSIKSKQLNESTVITLDRITLNQPLNYPFKM